MATSAMTGWWRRALIALAAFGASLAPMSMAPAADPAGDGWHPDSDSQFLLDVNLHQMTFGSGVRAYQTPEGACVLLGDFLTTLDVPMKIDLGNGRAEGWAFSEKNRIRIDRNSATAEFNGKRESFATTDIRETPDGWCVDQKALARWFGLGVKADVFNSLLLLDTPTKLPIELAQLRRLRGEALARAHKAALALSSAPGVRIPYRLWRTPALEVVVNAGVRYGNSKLAVSRGATTYAAGELGGLSYLASLAITDQGKPRNLWARFYRSDPEGHLLGPLHATHVAIGDVPGLSSTFRGAGANGRGFVVTNRPLNQLGSFDRTEFRGRLPDGWDAELYRNGNLVAFDNDPAKTGEYVFRDVDVMTGDNDYEIVLHGPQGQEQHVRDTLNVSSNSAPPGKFWYWAGVRQPGRDLLSFATAPPVRPPGSGTGAVPIDPKPGIEGVAQLQYGIDERTAVSALVRSTLDGDQHLTYVEGAVRRSIGPAVTELAALADSGGKRAVRAQLMARIGKATLTASSLIGNGLGEAGTDKKAVRGAHRLGIGIPLKLGSARIPLSLSAGRTDFSDGSQTLDGQLRFGAKIGPFDLANSTTWQRQRAADGAIDSRLTTELIAAGHVGPVRLRGSAEADVVPQSRLRSLYLDAYWSKSDNVEWDAGVRYDALLKRGSLQLSHVRRLDSMAVTVTGEAATDGSVAAGVRLSFSLDPAHSGLRPIRERLATQGLVHARVFEDVNENGRFDPGEPVEKNAVITTGTSQSAEVTDAAGKVTVGGLTPYVPLPVGIDQSSLDNPALTPIKPVQVIIPRPGVAADVDIALVGGGSIEGFATKADGSPYEGLDFELLDDKGQVVGTTRSDLDGYILFENIRYGKFSLRLDKGSASAIHAAPLEPLTVVLNRDKPAARIGSIRIAALN